MEKIHFISAAFDKRNPNPKINYGIQSCDLFMILKGKLGAVQFMINTGWYLPHVSKELPSEMKEPRALDLGYHSPKPMYKGHTKMNGKCVYATGGKCYHDGSGLNAQRICDILLSEGSEAVWKELEKYYKSTFGQLR